jgi:periplasmic divalent cation tolerance protein
MAETNPKARIVLTTAANAEEAGQIARALVEERLVACASLIPGVESVYRWKGAVETATETLMLIKTGEEQLAALETRLHELHSYETPEFLVLNVEAGSRGYLEWLVESLGKSRE